MEDEKIWTVTKAVEAQDARLEAVAEGCRGLGEAGTKDGRNDISHALRKLDQWQRTGAADAATVAITDACLMASSLATIGTDVLTDGISTVGQTSLEWSHIDIARGLTYLVAERDMLSSDTTFLPTEMLELIVGAAESLSPEKIRSSDIISPTGVVLFETPLPTHDYHPDTGIWCEDIHMEIRGFEWSVEGNKGVLIYPLTDYRSYHDVFLPSLEAVTGEDTTKYREGVKSHGLDHVRPMDYHFWEFDRGWGQAPVSDFDAHAYTNGTFDVNNLPEHIAGLRKLFLVFMRLFWQELLTREPAERSDISRPAIRRSERVRSKHKASTNINVVHLRRSSHAGPSTAAGRKLDHRLIVRGHWRNQWFRSLGPADDPASHRLIYINPHVRGPEEAPLVIKKKATII